MTKLAAKIEAVLFLSARPVSFAKLSKLLEVQEKDVREAVESLSQERNIEFSGIHVIVVNNAVELGTNPAFADVLKEMSKEEIESELTRPQLEALTIIAYRGPITKPEIEHIRGVNCSLILRNLLMRGLIIEKEDKRRMQDIYTVSSEMLRFLGIHSVQELPDFGELHKNAKITQMLETLFEEDSAHDV
jgi:segregation and condensation protein B